MAFTISSPTLSLFCWGNVARAQGAGARAVSGEHRKSEGKQRDDDDRASVGSLSAVLVITILFDNNPAVSVLL